MIANRTTTTGRLEEPHLNKKWQHLTAITPPGINSLSKNDLFNEFSLLQTVKAKNNPQNRLLIIMFTEKNGRLLRAANCVLQLFKLLGEHKC